ncbi:hypothetical protein SAMN05216388_102527 [Halorientalis persicus]|uniref:Uncharacterized protein n=1 Tax=Halorientalis persicus TaxID=1367881 RepID=A0A1H8U3R2_9EURY|nr:hypothetical protein [Halorientalis persicus]SEO97298.1 hypothetical protein SAMN05216388_102527 [Halorientalis persicus]
MVHPDPGKLQDTANYAEAVIDDGIDTSNVRALAEMRNAFRRLEKKAKKARQEVIEAALDDGVDVGDNVAGVRRVGSEHPKVIDKSTALQMLEDADADPAEAVTVNARQFIDAVDGTNVDPSKVIDYETRTQYRRTD